MKLSVSLCLLTAIVEVQSAPPSVLDSHHFPPTPLPGVVRARPVSRVLAQRKVNENSQNGRQHNMQIDGRPMGRHLRHSIEPLPQPRLVAPIAKFSERQPSGDGSFGSNQINVKQMPTTNNMKQSQHTPITPQFARETTVSRLSPTTQFHSGSLASNNRPGEQISNSRHSTQHQTDDKTLSAHHRHPMHMHSSISTTNPKHNPITEPKSGTTPTISHNNPVVRMQPVNTAVATNQSPTPMKHVAKVPSLHHIPATQRQPFIRPSETNPITLAQPVVRTSSHHNLGLQSQTGDHTVHRASTRQQHVARQTHNPHHKSHTQAPAQHTVSAPRIPTTEPKAKGEGMMPKGSEEPVDVFFVNYDDGEDPLLPGGLNLQELLRSAVHLEGQVIGVE